MSRGLAIAVPSNWSFEPAEEFKSDNQNCKALAGIVIPSGTSPLKIATCNSHPGTHFPPELFKKFKGIKFNNNNIKGILMGDFNSPHKAFGSRFTNSYGISILQGINDNDLICLNNGSPTIFSSISGEPNLLDLVLCEQDSVPLVRSCYVEADIGTDHRPVVTSLHLGQSRVCSAKRPPALDYAVFQKEIEEKFKNFDSTCFSICEVDTKISQMQLLFKESISAASKKPRKSNRKS